MNKIDILLETLNVTCKYYKEYKSEPPICNHGDNNNEYCNCDGNIKNCMITKDVSR